MRLLPMLIPFAVLAACGGAPKEEAAPADTTTTTAPVDAPMPPIAANARTAVAWDGSYSMTGTDGVASTLTLNKDDTYSWVVGSAAPVKGKFSWYKDGQRILLDAAGGKAVYAVADGAVYKLAGPDTLVTAPLDRAAMLGKVAAPAAAVEPAK